MKAGHPAGRICLYLVTHNKQNSLINETLNLDLTTDVTPWPVYIQPMALAISLVAGSDRSETGQATGLWPDAVQQLHRIPLPPYHPGLLAGRPATPP